MNDSQQFPEGSLFSPNALQQPPFFFQPPRGNPGPIPYISQQSQQALSPSLSAALGHNPVTSSGVISSSSINLLSTSSNLPVSSSASVQQMYSQYQFGFNGGSSAVSFFQSKSATGQTQQPTSTQPPIGSQQQQQQQSLSSHIFRSPSLLNPTTSTTSGPGQSALTGGLPPPGSVGMGTSAMSAFLPNPETSPSPQNPLSNIGPTSFYSQSAPQQSQQQQSQQQQQQSLPRMASSPNQRAKAIATAALHARHNGNGGTSTYTYFGSSGLSPPTHASSGMNGTGAVTPNSSSAIQMPPVTTTPTTGANGLYTPTNHMVSGMVSTSTYASYAALAKSMAMSLNANLPEQQWATLDLGGMGIKNLSLELFNYHFLTALYLNHNQLQHIPPDIAILKKLSVVDMSHNKLTSLPREMGLLTNLSAMLVFNNRIQQLPWEFGSLYKLETMGIDGNLISEQILSLNQKEGSQAVIQYLRDHSPAMNPPPERDWAITESEPPSAETGISETCSVFCFNILCDKYASSKLYGYTPSWALTWDYRKVLILQEILMYTADVVCLQEVEMDQYEKHFQSQMREVGDYESVFAPKSRARTMSDWERKSVDGCATFFRSAKYSLVEQHLIEFNQIAMKRQDFAKNEDVFNRLMTKDNIALFTVLENKETLTKILVANCHIHWDPELKDVKLVQVAMLMEELENFCMSKDYFKASLGSGHSYKGRNHGLGAMDRSFLNRLPIVICGDFNSKPDSGVYQLLSEGHVTHDHEDFGTYHYGNFTNGDPSTHVKNSTPEEDSKADNDRRDSMNGLMPVGPSHHLNLKSAYADGHQMPFTNFTPNFCGVIDYIWHTSNNMTVIGLLGPVDDRYASQIVGLPNAHFPSDHIPILAEFRIRGSQIMPPFSDERGPPELVNTGGSKHRKS